MPEVVAAAHIAALLQLLAVREEVAAVAQAEAVTIHIPPLQEQQTQAVGAVEAVIPLQLLIMAPQAVRVS
jgi:hypothetical protein